MNRKHFILLLLLLLLLCFTVYIYWNSTEHDYGYTRKTIHAGLDSSVTDNVLADLNTAFISKNEDIMIFKKNGDFVHFVKNNSFFNTNNVIKESGKWKNISKASDVDSTVSTIFYIKKIWIYDGSKFKTKHVSKKIEKYSHVNFDINNLKEAKLVIDFKEYSLFKGFELNSSNKDVDDLIEKLSLFEDI